MGHARKPSNKPIRNWWQPKANVSQRMVKRGSTNRVMRFNHAVYGVIRHVVGRPLGPPSCTVKPVLPGEPRRVRGIERVRLGSILAGCAVEPGR